jgi:PKD repeat protein
LARAIKRLLIAVWHGGSHGTRHQVGIPSLSSHRGVRRAAAFTVIGTLLGFTGLTAVVGPVQTSAATFSIAVQGNHFVNGSGQTIRLLGVNRSGSEYMCGSAGGNTFDGPVDDAAIASIAAWHTNAVRVPLNEDCWLGINGFPVGQTAASYQQAITAFVNRLHAHGQYAILELHWNNGGTAQSTAQMGMADADHGPAFWTSVATSFKSDPAVLFDLYNEPHDITWDCWKNGGCADPVGGFTVAGMQTLLNAVRATGATQPILAGGLAYANDMSQWLSFKPTDSGNALVASIHNYNFNSCISLSCWNSVYQPIATSYPVVTGELGENDCAHGYIDSYMNWADQNGVSYLAWAWNTYSCNTFPALISNFNGTPTAFGAGFQTRLATLAGTAAPACPSSSSVPCYDHIFTIVMENHSYNQVIGAPYIASLAAKGAVGGNYFATDHPSLPNYAEMTSGQSFPNAPSDCDPSSSCQSTARNIIDPVVASGRTWHSYQESMGAACGKVTSGQYAPKHNPFVYYTDISAASCQANVVDYSNLANDLKSSTLANYVFITPNLCNDMHDCSVSTGDTWLSNNVPTILNSAAFTQQHSLLVLLWDEDDHSQGNQVAWIGVGYGVKTNYVSSVRYDHYSFLKTIETAWGLSTLTSTDASASTMTDLFGAVSVPPLSATAGGSLTSGTAPLTVNFSSSASGGVAPYTYSWNFGDGTAASTSQNPSHVYASAGTFTATVTVSDSAAHTATASAPTVTVNLAPLTAVASANPTAGDAPLTVAFTGSAGGGTAPYSYAWAFGDTSTSTSQNPSHAYSAAGSYTATLTVTDATAQKATAMVAVVVSPALSVAATGSPQTIDQGDSVSFTSTPSGGKTPFTYSWNFGDGSVASTAQNPSHVYSTAGMVTATLTLTDGNGVKATASVQINVHSLPTVSASGSPTSGDGTLTVNLSSTASGGTTPYSYSWDFGDGSAASTVQNPSHTYAAVGNYVATVTVSDALAHTAKATVGVSVSPALTATASASPTSGQAPLTVSLSASPSGGKTPYTYSWNFGDGTAASSAQNPTHPYGGPGTFVAQVTITDANGVNVTANAPAVSVTPAPLVASVSTSPAIGDAPLTTTLTAGATGGTPPYIYGWDLGDGSTSSQQMFTHSYAVGSYTVTLTITDGAGKSAQATGHVTVYPALSVSSSVTPVAGDAPLSVAFTSSATGGLAPYTFGWSFGDGTTGSGANATHAYSAGTYRPTLTVHDAAGGTWSANVATINSAAVAPAPVPGGGGGGGGQTQPPVGTPAAGSTPTPAATPTPEVTPTPTASPAAAPGASGSGSGMSPGVVLLLIGSALVSGLGALVFVGWQRGRLR